MLFFLFVSVLGILFSPFKGKSLSLICGALKWLADSEERDKARIEAVLAGDLPPSALEEPGVFNSNSEEKGGTPATESTVTAQGIKIVVHVL